MTTLPNTLAIGLDIGGTDTKAVIVNAQGIVLHESKQSTVEPERASKTCVIERLRDRIASLQKLSPTKIDRIGVAIPGMASRDERTAAWLPKDKLDLQGVTFEDAFAWKAPVPTLNDAHAALLGEVWHGAAAGKRDVVMLTLGTGVGGAILSDGKLIRGALGRGGHLGHIGIGIDSPPSVVGLPGALEEAIGTISLKRRSKGRFTKTIDLINAADAGDADAAAIWDRSVKDLAYAIASFINMLDPELIVISGGIAEADDKLFGPLRKHLAPIEWKPTGTSVPIVKAKRGEMAGAIGAASRALGATG